MHKDYEKFHEALDGLKKALYIIIKPMALFLLKHYWILIIMGVFLVVINILGLLGIGVVE